MRRKGFTIGVAVVSSLFVLALLVVRTYVLAVELDPETGFAAPGEGWWQNVFLAALLAATVLLAGLCALSSRMGRRPRFRKLPPVVRWVGLAASAVLAAEAVAGSFSAVTTLGAFWGLLATLAKIAISYSVFAQALCLTGGNRLAFHPVSLVAEAVPAVYCIALLLDTFFHYVAFNSTSQHLMEQMSVIAVMLFFLEMFGICLRVNRAGDDMVAAAAGLLGSLFLAVSILPPCFVFILTGTMPAFLTKAAGFSPVMGFCLMVNMGSVSLFALFSKESERKRILTPKEEKKKQ